MALNVNPFSTELDTRFKLFHELMQWKVRDILLVSTPYDAWVLEEDCRLSERIITEYRGLNLSKPPRLTWVRSAEEALAMLDERQFDLVLTMTHLADMNPGELGRKIKAKAPDLPVVLLSHTMVVSETAVALPTSPRGIDRTFVWSGDTDILVALVKSAEDRMNVEHDTRAAGIRVILFVQESPYFLSSLLPILYHELVCQTQAMLESGLNEEHRLLTMRARPKILIAGSYEEALALFQKFEPYVLGVISDVQIPREERSDPEAGVALLAQIRRERFDIPLLLTGATGDQQARVADLGVSFVDKRSPFLRSDVRAFLKEHLGFGEFVFTDEDGRELGRAGNLRELVDGINTIPEAVLLRYCQRNDFSRWLFARTEIVLASQLRPVTQDDFPDMASHRRYLAEMIQARYLQRYKGIVVNYDASDFIRETEFAKIGKGSLGGKARGLAFVSSLLQKNDRLQTAFGNVEIRIPQTLVITTEGFESFVNENRLEMLARTDLPDEEVAARFLAGRLPEELVRTLRSYLLQADYPLAVRSSSLLEDAQHHAYAGLYQTYMLPNDGQDLEQRLDHLLQAVRLVYASTYFQGPRAYARRVGHRTEEEKMAVIVQELAGLRQGKYFYPSLSGVAQSRNYYPQARMKTEDGIAAIALGLGRMVVAGERTLRFSPKYPKFLPQRSTVDEVLAYAQRHFYALQMGKILPLGLDDGATLLRRDVSDAFDEYPVQLLSSTYVPEEHRIRDTLQVEGARVLTFASVLKYDTFPLAGLLRSVLTMGEEGMGRPVEIEFSVNLAPEGKRLSEFAILQMRPMTARAASVEVTIEEDEIAGALCYATRVMGNAIQPVGDLVYVKLADFDAGRTREVAREVAELNAALERQGRKYVLVGPGRWGSQDTWLGIPVQWADISGVGTIVETMSAELKAEPSQGSHFFHNLAALGISYFCVTDRKPDFIDWPWLVRQPVSNETRHVAHIHLDKPLLLKVDGRTSSGLIRQAEEEADFRNATGR